MVVVDGREQGLERCCHRRSEKRLCENLPRSHGTLRPADEQVLNKTALDGAEKLRGNKQASALGLSLVVEMDQRTITAVAWV